MDKVNWTKLEEKWRQRWIKEKDFEAEPDSREKKFITVAYPYPNSPQHVGHGRTYTTADVHARFLRMMGYNVLFPNGVSLYWNSYTGNGKKSGSAR